MLHLQSLRRSKRKRGLVLGPLDELVKKLKKSVEEGAPPADRRHLRVVKR